ncbi:MAG: PIN domain-containing protein [Thiomargarita sp.]|nr:PIN domain-containing protein [Thiomargarita sp.]
MILCDTDILIEFYKDNSQIIQELRYIKPYNIAISSITTAELYFGALNKIELEKIKKHLEKISCISLDRAISQQFIQLMETYALMVNGEL